MRRGAEAPPERTLRSWSQRHALRPASRAWRCAPGPRAAADETLPASARLLASLRRDPAVPRREPCTREGRPRRERASAGHWETPPAGGWLLERERPPGRPPGQS